MGGLIGELNRQAQQVEESILKAHIPVNFKSASRELRVKLLEQHVPTTAMRKFTCHRLARHLVNRLLNDGLLVSSTDGQHFFSSLEAMRYLGGAWLEEWAWLIADDCGLDDCRSGVFIQASEGGKESSNDDNEMDLVLLHQNRLLIAECKTINWQGANGKQDILNKLDALGSHARGLFGRSLLVSARPLDDDASRRAGAYGVTVLQADSLPDLKKEIRKWMGRPNSSA
jgi:hypothetical protein